MITIFNRKELIITYDLNKQSSVRDILSANNIPYTIKTASHTGSTSALSGARRGHQRTLGVNMSVAYEYKIYVKKEDYEKASYLINKAN